MESWPSRFVSWARSPSPSSPIEGGINNFSYRTVILQIGSGPPYGFAGSLEKRIQREHKTPQKKDTLCLQHRAFREASSPENTIRTSGQVRLGVATYSDKCVRDLDTPPPRVRSEPTSREGLGMSCNHLFSGLPIVRAEVRCRRVARRTCRKPPDDA